jgi:glycosyltransferase involved in cell wall biosynthesis
LKVIHLSDMPLPDWRIEKSALSDANQGHEVYFGGLKSKYSGKIFSRVFEIQWTPRARRAVPLYWRSVKRQLSQILSETKPDVIHAHNIFSAKMASEFEIPFVYDDHEYWSRLSLLLKEMAHTSALNEESLGQKGFLKTTMDKATQIRRSAINSYAIRLWTKWEQEIVSLHPTITVSEQIASDLRANYKAKDVFVVPNFPMLSEVKDFEKPQFHNSLSSVYAGVEAKGETTPAHRNIDGFIASFLRQDIGDLVVIGWDSKSPSAKVKYMGFLPRQVMYKEMFNHSIGLVPFRKHWSHVYISPNKAYEYAHAGLVVLSTSGFEPIKGILGRHCITFEDYEDMASKLKYFKENLDELYERRLQIFDFARENLIWEKNENSIIEAYKRCV